MPCSSRWWYYCWFPLGTLCLHAKAEQYCPFCNKYNINTILEPRYSTATPYHTNAILFLVWSECMQCVGEGLSGQFSINLFLPGVLVLINCRIPCERVGQNHKLQMCQMYQITRTAHLVCFLMTMGSDWVDYLNNVSGISVQTT